jgi:hypothetical protein
MKHVEMYSDPQTIISNNLVRFKENQLRQKR